MDTEVATCSDIALDPVLRIPPRLPGLGVVIGTMMVGNFVAAFTKSDGDHAAFCTRSIAIWLAAGTILIPLCSVGI